MWHVTNPTSPLNFTTVLAMANANAIVAALLFTEHPATVVDHVLLNAVAWAYDKWEVKMQEIIDNAFGDCTVDDFWKNPEQIFVFVNQGHGVSFADDVLLGSRYYAFCKIANVIARRMMPELESNLYLDEEGESKTLRCMGI
jgi:hypothetical protein